MVRSTPSRASKANDHEDESAEKPPAEVRKTPPKKQGKTTWSPAEDEALMVAVEEDRKRRESEGDDEDEEDWDEIATAVPGKSAVQCFRRYSGHLAKGEAAASAGTRRSRDQGVSDDSPSPASKRSKTDSGEEDWTTDELELLKKLVEHYNDSA
jgi:hypothetical protein